MIKKNAKGRKDFSKENYIKFFNVFKTLQR